jgi:hypothetical protein
MLYLLKLKEFIICMMFPVVQKEGQANKDQLEFLIALSGSFDVVLKKERGKFWLH